MDSLYAMFQISNVHIKKIMAILLYGLRGLKDNQPYEQFFGQNVNFVLIPYCIHAKEVPEPIIRWSDPCALNPV